MSTKLHRPDLRRRLVSKKSRRHLKIKGYLHKEIIFPKDNGNWGVVDGYVIYATTTIEDNS